MDKQIIIAVSGAQGVGKTTFCNDLKSCLNEKFKDKEICIKGGVSRGLINRGIASDDLTESQDYALFFKAHFENVSNSSSANIIILDRTFLDTLTYAIINENMHPNWLLFCQSIAKYIITRIDIYFYIPVDSKIELEDDGIRNVNKNYQLQLNECMANSLSEFYPNHIKLFGMRNQRVNQAMNFMKELLNVH